MGIDLPEGWVYNKAGRLYNAADRRMAGKADAEALGVPFMDPGYVKQPKTPKAAGKKISIEPGAVKHSKAPKTPKGSEPQDEPTPKKTAAKTAVKEDQADLKELLGTACDGLARATGFPGWRITEDDAEQVARPLSRILARNRSLDRAVKTYSDPALLAIAVFSVFIVRGFIFIAWLRAGRPPLQQTVGGQGMPQPPPPPPPPAPPPGAGASVNPPTDIRKPYGNGRASDATADAISRIQGLP